MVAASGAAPAVAQATLPGRQGKIAYEHVNQWPRDLQIHTISRAGTGDAQITSGTPVSGSPSWSPDGAKIAYAHGTSLYVANPDGSGAAPILTWSDAVGASSWSPDRQRLAVELRTCEADECRFDIYVVGRDGSGLLDVTPDLVEERNPSWSPDGTKIAFDSARSGSYDIWTVAPDGTGLARLTTNDTVAETNPDWSPDGTRIVYVWNGSSIVIARDDGTYVSSLGQAGDFRPDYDPAWSPDGYLIAFVHEIPNQGCVGVRRAIFFALYDGQARTQVTAPAPVGQECSADANPAWQPLPTSYVRPRRATPLRVPLVPAYRQCTSPNTTHGAPLSFGSCAPPVQDSTTLTVGTPEANGLRGTMVGSLVIRAIPGDVQLDFSLTDILRQETLTAYDGPLRVVLRVRITDTLNFDEDPLTAAEPGTGSTMVPFDVQCYAGTVGGSCSLHSTLNAVTYGHAVVEGRRTILELEQVQVYEPGPDGTFATGDERLFAVQGVFVP